MYEWAIIDGDDVNYDSAKKVKATHPTAIDPVKILRVTAIDCEGKLRLLIYTDRRIKLEECLDRGCIHLVEYGESENEKEQKTTSKME